MQTSCLRTWPRGYACTTIFLACMHGTALACTALPVRKVAVAGPACGLRDPRYATSVPILPCTGYYDYTYNTTRCHDCVKFNLCLTQCTIEGMNLRWSVTLGRSLPIPRMGTKNQDDIGPRRFYFASSAHLLPGICTPNGEFARPWTFVEQNSLCRMLAIYRMKLMLIRFLRSCAATFWMLFLDILCRHLSNETHK